MRRAIWQSWNRTIAACLFSIATVWVTGFFTSIVVEAQRPVAATVFEGARLIVGDSSAPIADSAFLVENGRFTAVGRKGQLKVPAGTARVDLTGKTVMPAIVDAHKHLAVRRDALVDQLQHLAYYGIGAAHKKGLRTIAHIYTLEDAKGTLRAGIDNFAHSVRDKDIGDEYLNLIKAKPNFIVDPSLPDRGVKVDRSWLRDSVTAAEL